MTGFIKPSEIWETQELLVDLMEETDRDLSDVGKDVQEFLQIHPVTKEKESGTFRYVNGVYVTDEDFQNAERLERSVDRLLD